MLGRFWRADWPLLGRLVAIGAPISGGFLLEYGLFAAAAPLMGLIGTTALAAHQIALTVAAILYMVPFGISIAATVRVGHAVGRRDAVATRRAGFAAIALAAAFMTAMTIAVVGARDLIPRLFLGNAASDASATVALAAGLLLVGATFFIADGMQAIAAGALRGLNDTRVPLLFSALSFWGVGFTAAYALAFPAGYGAYGVWIGLSLGTGVYAVLLVARFQALTRRGYLPAVSGADESGSAALRAADDRATRHRACRPPRRRRCRHARRTGLRALRAARRDRHGRAGRRSSRSTAAAAVEAESADRVPPICPHFGVCGGCAMQHWRGEQYRAWKRGLVVAALAQAGLSAPVDDLIDAHGEGRRRVVLHARRGAQDVLQVGFAAARSHRIVPIDRCPVLAPVLAGAIKIAWSAGGSAAAPAQAARYPDHRDRCRPRRRPARQRTADRRRCRRRWCASRPAIAWRG